MIKDPQAFGCSYLSPDGEHCLVHEGTEDTGPAEAQERERLCGPDECPLLEDLMLGGDLFSG